MEPRHDCSVLVAGLSYRRARWDLATGQSGNGDGASSENSTLVAHTRNTSPKLHTLYFFLLPPTLTKPLQLTESLNKILITYSTKKRRNSYRPRVELRAKALYAVPDPVSNSNQHISCWLYRNFL